MLPGLQFESEHPPHKRLADPFRQRTLEQLGPELGKFLAAHDLEVGRGKLPRQRYRPLPGSLHGCAAVRR